MLDSLVETKVKLHHDLELHETRNTSRDLKEIFRFTEKQTGSEVVTFWFSAGSAEELQRRLHQEAADRQLRHADGPRQDGRALPLLQPAAPQPAGQTQETSGAEAGEEEPGAAACGRIHRAQLLLRVFSGPESFINRSGKSGKTFLERFWSSDRHYGTFQKTLKKYLYRRMRRRNSLYQMVNMK